YIPAWSWGRSFDSGHSVGRPPEQSLALILGQCTSAPAGPLTGYLSALLASLPKGTIMSRLLLLLNNFVRMKKWERLWGNPIRAGHDPNPFYGHNNKPRHHSRIASPDSNEGNFKLLGNTRIYAAPQDRKTSQMQHHPEAPPQTPSSHFNFELTKSSKPQKDSTLISGSNTLPSETPTKLDPFPKPHWE